MFELVDVDPEADESALVAGIAAMERFKAAAAARQARLTVALERSRRQAEEAAGMPAARRGRGLAAEVALARRDSRRAGRAIWGWPRRWSTRCRTLWPHLNVGRSRNGGPPFWFGSRPVWIVRIGVGLDTELCSGCEGVGRDG